MDQARICFKIDQSIVCRTIEADFFARLAKSLQPALSS
jgi:hypothetical protein